LAAFHGQHVLLCRDGDLLRLEAGQSERDAIVILPDACDVVGRIVVLALQPERIVDEVEQAIETDGRPPDGGEIEVSHSHILHLSNMDIRGAQRAAAPLDFADPRMGECSRRESASYLCRPKIRRAKSADYVRNGSWPCKNT